MAKGPKGSAAVPGGKKGSPGLTVKPVKGSWDGHPGVKPRAKGTDVRTGTIGNVSAKKAC